jgi:hypothetical protein
MAVATVLLLDRSGGCGTWPIKVRGEYFVDEGFFGFTLNKYEQPNHA